MVHVCLAGPIAAQLELPRLCKARSRSPPEPLRGRAHRIGRPMSVAAWRLPPYGLCHTTTSGDSVRDVRVTLSVSRLPDKR